MPAPFTRLGPARHRPRVTAEDFAEPLPAEPRVARALALLIDQINATPPRMPGDTRPITYQLTPNPAI